MKLTPTTIRALSLPQGKADETFTDDDLPGLGLRLRAGGSRTWVYRYKIGGRFRRVTLGALAALSPAQARKTAGELHAMVRLGRDPAGEKEAGRARTHETMAAALRAYLPYQLSRLRPRSYREVERHLQKCWQPLHGMPLTAIDRRAVAARLAVLAGHGPVLANRARASLSAFFTWAMREGLADANPVAATGKRPERSRDRVLAMDELKAIWEATADAGDYSAVVRLLMLTGCRLSEIAALRWSEVGNGEIVLPPGRTKNARRHAVPLSSAASAVLGGRPRRPGRDLVFGRRHDRPLKETAEAKRALDARIGEAAGAALAHWVNHDLRRSVATHMAELGVLPHVIEAALNHASGHKAGVAGVYNRWSYEPEKRKALDMWAEHLMAAVEGRDEKIVSLRA